MDSNEKYRQRYPEASSRNTKQAAVEEKFHHDRQNATRICKLRETVVADFCHSVGGFLLFRSQNQSGSVLCPGKYLPKHSGTRGAKGTCVLRRAGMDKGAQLDWRGHRCKISGVLADPKGGKIQSSCFFCVVSTAIKGAARVPARRPWSRNDVCLLLARKNNGRNEVAQC